MATKVRNLSALINDQLPNFIASEYPKFSSFIQKYYEQLELPGQPVDLISNLVKYKDVDSYENEVLEQNTKLLSTINQSDNTIFVEDTSSFPASNGYILIDDEIIFYKSKTNTSFVDCYRNVSGNTKLGDLYSDSEFNAVPYDDLGTGVEHIGGSLVSNISNLFLYALIKNFEKEYLAGFPTKNLKESINKNLLIKNIKSFYQAKGTDQSIQFIFNSLVSEDPLDVPTVYYPKDSTYKLSNADWINNFSLKVKILSGDVSRFIGERIVQEETNYDPSIKNSFAVIDNIKDIGNGFYEFILARESVVGEFAVSAKTFLTKNILTTDTENDRINVYSTLGWNFNSGAIVVGNEIIEFKDKSVNQFVIGSRGSFSSSYAENTEVYSYSSVSVDYTDSNGSLQKGSILILGILYDLSPENVAPYSFSEDKVEISGSGFDTRDTVIYDTIGEKIRWIINENNLTVNATVSGVDNVLHSVSAIFEDDQYYYIASSGYPGHLIGTNAWTQSLQDQKNLKLIRKVPTKTTEIYKTPSNEVGILLNGTTVRSYKDTDEDLVIFGEITEVEVLTQGNGYVNPPYILIQDGAGSLVASAKAIMNGSVVERIEVIETGSGFFPPVPSVTVTSGRGAVLEAIVTRDRVTSLVIKNPGEYYSSPPRIIIRDRSGKGRFASFTAEISNDGKIIGVVKNAEGKFYSQENIEVIVEPVGFGATARSIVKSWRKNLVKKYESTIDANNGHYFLNNNPALGYGYSYLANPKSLRVLLNDNLDGVGNVPTVLSHSPIIGYAFDGNPIYGPYGFSDPLDSTSSIQRLLSSYSLNSSRNGGPSIVDYPLGSFVEDYTYNHRSGSLDENNGRFCVTPDYPEGVYAYFVTIDANNTPVFPYIIGQNFYSIPVDSNYNKNISQNLIPKNISRLRTGKTKDDGEGVYGYIESIETGNVNQITVESTPSNFSVGSNVVIDYKDSGGDGIIASVGSVKGLPVSSIESIQTKAIKVETQNTVYLFDGDTLYQNTTGAQGEIVGNVFDDKTIVLRNISGTFNTTNTLYSSTPVINLILDKTSDYKLNSEIVLTNGKQVVILNVNNNSLNVALNPFSNGEPVVFTNTFSGITQDVIYYVVDSSAVSFKVSTSPNGSPISLTSNSDPSAVAINQKAKGIVLENTLQRNSLKLRTVQGEFSIVSDYFLKSNNLEDTIGSKIVSINSLSSNIKVLNLKENIAIVETVGNHGISKGDEVNIDISPDDTLTETTIYVRRKIYQKVKLNIPSYTKRINDTGVGSTFILNNGSYNTILDISSVARSSNVATITTSTAHNLSFGDEVSIFNVPGYAATNVTVLSTPTSTSFTYGNQGINQSTTTVSTGTVGESVGDYAFSSSGTNTFTDIELIFSDISKSRDSEGRIVGDSDLSFIGRPGSINNAKATIEVRNGIVVSVTITSKGKGYQRGDLLTVNPDDLDRNPSSTSPRFLLLEITHVGLSKDNTILYLNDVASISEQDLLQVGDEVVKVSSINVQNSFVTITRGEENTEILDHFNSQEVKSYFPQFDLPAGYSVGSNAGDASVFEYNPTTGELTVVYDLGRTISNINSLVPNFAFFDNSTPSKLVTISDVSEEPSYKFELSYDNTNWSRNPVLNLQNYYKYKFDTSHYTLRNSFLEFSPSGNYNIITEESVRNTILPGNAGSFVTLKVGYGPNISSNNYTEKQKLNYNTYFYFDKNGIIDSDKSFIRIIEDPLQGNKIITYITPNKFVYEMDSSPSYDGSGSITYTTNALLATGEVNTILLSNQGNNFSYLPVVSGIVPSGNNECIATVNYNEVAKNISSVNIVSSGVNYSKPKVVLLNADGIGAEFDVLKNSSGGIAAITIKDKGRNYTRKPEIKIIETDVKAYCSSNNIGVPKNVRIVFNGKNFSRDISLKKSFSGCKILVLKNISNSTFRDGEKIEQYEGNSLIASGYVTRNGWKENTNILRLRDVIGEFKPNISIVGKIGNRTAVVSNVVFTEFSSQIKSYYDNLGYYSSDRGHLSSNNQKLLDSFFYQDYSYVIKSKTPINIWRDLIKNTTHPAGFKLFGEVTIESSGSNAIPIQQSKPSTISIVQLWDPEKNKITVENTYKTITQSSVRISNTNVLEGAGSAYSPAFDTGETVSYELALTPDFDGYFNEQGNRQGTTTFNIRLAGTNIPYSVPKEENIILSLDGILQEPGKSYTVSGTQITFAQPPLGYRSVFGDPIPFSSYIEGVDTPSQKFVARSIRFKDSTLNDQYFRKIKDITNQFDNSKLSFDLYYEDDTPVVLDSNENLIVSIDGIVQRAGVTPLLPSDRSYYIRKTVVPNQIVFVEPPRTFDSQYQSFYAFSVGSFERLKLDDRYIDGINKGPFIMRSCLTDKTTIVDEDRNVLVFVDEVLQKRTRDYSIRGSNITFTNPILLGQKVNIMYLYGRETSGVITAFDYENITPWINRINITVSGQINVYSHSAKVYSNSAVGKLKGYHYSSGNTILVIDAPNKKFLNTESFTIEYYDNFYPSTIISSSDIIDISDFEENDNLQDILRRDDPGWLRSHRAKISFKDRVQKQDFIKIDGEDDYRTILSVPDTVTKTDYRDNDYLSSSYFGRLSSTNYNGISRGEGLDVVAEIQNGKVVNLLWNRIIWGDVYTKKIIPRSPGYGYENAPKLEFVPQPQKDDSGNIISPAQGGGAKAYVVVQGGQVVDIVLYDQGSDYLIPPRVYVSRSYDHIQNNRKLNSLSIISLSPEATIGDTLYVSTGDRIDADIPPAVFISSFLVVTPFNTEEDITCILQRQASVTVSSEVKVNHSSELNLGIDVSSISVIVDKFQRTIETPIEIATFNNISVQNVYDEFLTQLRAFAPVNYIFAYRSMHETGAYLTASMSSTIDIAYIADTQKFTDTGKLLIEDEVVYYGSKLSDRFLELIRGDNGTTAKPHAAGSFVRQYREEVSIIDVGAVGTPIIEAELKVVTISDVNISIVEVLQIESSSSLQDVSYFDCKYIQLVPPPAAIESSTDTELISVISYDINISTFVDISKTVTTIIESRVDSIVSNSVQSFTPEYVKDHYTGFVDYYIETAVLNNSIQTRNSGIVVLDPPINEILTRNGGIVAVLNSIGTERFVIDYPLRTSLTNRLGQYNEWKFVDVGTVGVSNLTLAEIEAFFSVFIIKDFEDNADSSYSFSSSIWNYGYPSIQNPVTISTNTESIGSVISVQSTTNFPDSGYLYHSNGTDFGIIQYTGKTSGTFTGCVVYSGSANISNTSQIIPYSI